MKVFVSVPAFNEAQIAGADKILEILEKAGIETLPKMSPDKEPKLSDRLPFVAQADRVLLWTDGLLPEGVTVRALAGLQNQIELPFPAPLLEILNAGIAVRGGGGSLAGKKQTILLPGQVEQQAECPKGMKVGLPPNMAIAQILSPGLNIPATPVLFEAGYAAALGKPLAALQLGESPGPYFSEEDGVEILKSFDAVEAWARRLMGITGEETKENAVQPAAK
jgi:nucleoside 2-deoxyribosyltransferase